MFSVYLSVGRWKGFNKVTCTTALQLNLGYLSICLATTDFERLFADILRHEGDYRFVKREYIFRLEDRLLQTIESLEESENREAALEARVLSLEHELDS